MENDENTVETETVEEKEETAIAKSSIDERYPSNSYRSRRAESEERESREIKPVAHGTAVKRKKSLKERIAGWLFVDADDYEDYIYEDFIRPAITDVVGDLSHNVFDTVLDAIDTMLDAIDTALFGGDGSRRGRYRRRGGYYRTSIDDYDEYWNREKRGRRRRDRDRDDDRRYSRRSDDVAAKLETRGEAVRLIEAMQDRVHKFNCASVLNFYDFADMPTRSTDDDYGWDLGHPFEATITRIRDGFIVEPVAPIWLDR